MIIIVEVGQHFSNVTGLLFRDPLVNTRTTKPVKITGFRLLTLAITDNVQLFVITLMLIFIKIEA